MNSHERLKTSGQRSSLRCFPETTLKSRRVCPELGEGVKRRTLHYKIGVQSVETRGVACRRPHQQATPLIPLLLKEGSRRQGGRGHRRYKREPKIDLVRADAERERNYSNDRKAWIVAQLAQAEAEVMDQIFDPTQPVRVATLFFLLLYSAEGTPHLFWRHPS